MIRLFIIALITLQGLSAKAQLDSLVDSGVCLEKAKLLFDSGKYELAIKKLLRIDPRDTNYVHSLSELTKSYFENKQYDEAISTCEKGLERPSSFRASLLNSITRAYTAKRNFEKAYTTISAAIKEFPFDCWLRYRYGIILYEQKRYNEAEQQFFKAIDLNPYHSGAHLYLSKIAMLRDQKVQGMFAMGIYLAINNTVNSQLVVLESFVKNEMPTENAIPSDSNSFDRMDEILRAKISFEGDYKTKIPIDIGVVKQYQMLFDLLREQPPKGDDSWIKFYLTVYNDLLKSNMQDAFVYHILESTPIEAVTKWQEKNKKEVKQFYTTINSSLMQFSKKRSLPEMGYAAPVACDYYDNGNIRSIGDKDANGKYKGKWYYFDENGSKLAEGHYKDDEKTGVWNYFKNNGVHASRENLDTGEMEIMDADGVLTERYFLKDEKVTGAVQIFYPCGTLKSITPYKDGKKDGSGKTYFANGKLEAEYFYKADSLDGKYISWYDDGTKHEDQEYKMGKNIARYTSFYRNGKIAAIGNYDHGKANGEWHYYYENGKLKKKLSFKNDLSVGAEEGYNMHGELIEKIKYNEQGEYEGENNFYHEGVLHSQTVNNNGLITALIYYDKSGKIISSSKNPEGTFKGKGFFPTGELQVDFSYTKGERDGAWRYYYRTGKLLTKCEYKAGKLVGEYLDYYENGSIKTKANYLNGELDGMYAAYYESGIVKYAGWYRDGNREQRLLTFYGDGSTESDSYYLRDAAVGFTLNFSEDGKLYSKEIFNQEGKIKTLIKFNRDGEQASEAKYDDANNQIITQKYKSGQIAFQSKIKCGDWDGETVHFLPDGKVFFSTTFAMGSRQGKYVTSATDGTIEVRGNFVDDKLASNRVYYYDNGNKLSEENFIDGTRDSVYNSYYYNGKIFTTSSYLDDLRQGESRYFGMDGQPFLYKMYNEGDLISIRTMGKDGKLSEWVPFSGSGKILSYFSNGTLAIEESYESGSYTDVRKVFYSDGKLYSVYNYAKNMVQGECFIYYPDGKIKEKLVYKDDIPHGVWEYYGTDGNIQRREPYFLGSVNGVVEFFSNGKKIREVKFWGGHPID